MKRFLGLATGVLLLIGFTASAQAAIKIEIAEVQNGAAYVKGNGAQNGAQITWDGNAVTTANKNNGGVLFYSVGTADMVRARSDGGAILQLACVCSRARCCA